MGRVLGLWKKTISSDSLVSKEMVLLFYLLMILPIVNLFWKVLGFWKI
jgi:hypothetical protein